MSKVYPKHENNGGLKGNRYASELGPGCRISTGEILLTRRSLVTGKIDLYIKYTNSPEPRWVTWNAGTIVNVKDNDD